MNFKTRLGLGILAFFTLIAVIGEWIAPYDPSAMSDDLLSPPSGAHWFGTTMTGEEITAVVTYLRVEEKRRIESGEVPDPYKDQ